MYIPKNAFYNPNFNPYKVNCEQITCSSIDAYVNCIGDIIQGRWGCVQIQLVDQNGLPLDLSIVRSIEVIVTNSFGYYVGHWGWIKEHELTKDCNNVDVYQRPIGDIYQEDNDIWVVYETGGSGNCSGSGTGSGSGSGGGIDITNKGLIGIMLTPEQTYTTTGPLTAQIIVTMDGEGKCNTYVISCIVIANIVASMIGNVCIPGITDAEDSTTLSNMIYKNLNKVIIPISIYDIPYSATITEVATKYDITEVGYYKVEDKYYQCDYYSQVYDDKDLWVLYDLDED